MRPMILLKALSHRAAPSICTPTGPGTLRTEYFACRLASVELIQAGQLDFDSVIEENRFGESGNRLETARWHNSTRDSFVGTATALRAQSND